MRRYYRALKDLDREHRKIFGKGLNKHKSSQLFDQKMKANNNDDNLFPVNVWHSNEYKRETKKMKRKNKENFQTDWSFIDKYVDTTKDEAMNFIKQERNNDSNNSQNRLNTNNNNNRINENNERGYNNKWNGNRNKNTFNDNRKKYNSDINQGINDNNKDNKIPDNKNTLSNGNFNRNNKIKDINNSLKMDSNIKVRNYKDAKKLGNQMRIKREQIRQEKLRLKAQKERKQELRELRHKKRDKIYKRTNKHGQPLLNQRIKLLYQDLHQKRKVNPNKIIE